MKKEFNNLAIKQLKSIYSIHHQQQLDQEETSNLIKPDNEIFEALTKALPWSHLYELPYKEFLAVCTLAFKQSDVIKSAAASPDPTQVIIDDIDNSLDTEDKAENLTGKEKGFRASLTIAANMQQLSFSIHGQTLSQLVERIGAGDDRALFDAVIVDRSILSAPTVARRIQTAQLCGDESFLNLLSKAITKTQPRRPKVQYDDLRFLVNLIDEEYCLDDIHNDKLYDFLADDLELYDGSPDGLEKFIQRIRKKSRT